MPNPFAVARARVASREIEARAVAASETAGGKGAVDTRMIGFSAGLPNQGILSKMPNMGGAIPLRSEAPAEYQRTGATVRVRGFERHPVVQACIRAISDLFATIPYQAFTRARGADPEDIEVLSPDHPANLILEHPSPMFSAQRFRSLTSVHYLTYGNALWFFERPDAMQGEVLGGQRGYRDPPPVSLRLIQPEDLLSVYVNQKAYPLWYWWRDVLGYPHVSPVTDIMHFRDLNAKGIVFGYPRAAAALNEIIGDDEASQHVRQIVTNSGMPPAFALAEEYLTPEKAAEMESVLYEKWITRGERGRFSFIGGVKDVKAVGFNLSDLEFPELRQISREGICFAPGTLVHTARGMVAIDKVVSGDRVLTHRGRYRTVMQTMVREHKGEMRRIGAKGLAPVLCTPNHPWLADFAKPAGRASNKRRRTAEPQWLAAEELQPRQTLPGNPRHYRRKGSHRLTMPHMAVDGARVDLLRWYDRPVEVDGRCVRPKNGRGTWLPRFLDLTEDSGWLFGLYLAEGAVGNNVTLWSLNATETGIASRALSILADMGIVGSATPNDTNGQVVAAHSNILRAFFAQCGTDSASKHIPEWAMTAPPAFRRGMIAGYADGDGSTDRGSTRVTTVSTSLASQLRMLLWTERRHGALSVADRKTWSIEGRSGVARPSITVNWKDEPKRRGAVSHEDGYSAFPLMQNSVEPYEGPVYNLSVDEDESYVTVGGTTHNCAAFGIDPRMIGIGSASKDGGLSGEQYREARTRLMQQTVEPMLNSFISELNMWLAPEFGVGVYYRYDPEVYAKLVEDHEATSARVAREVAAGLRTVEEGREAIDLEPTMDPTHMLAIGPVQFVPVAQALTAGTAPPQVGPDGQPLPPGAGGPMGGPPAPGMLGPGAPVQGDPGTTLPPPGDGPQQLGAGNPSPMESMNAGPSLAATTGLDPNDPTRVPQYNDGARDPEDKRVNAQGVGPGASGVPGDPPVAGSPTDIAAANGAAPAALTGPITTPPPTVTAAEWARIGQILKLVPLDNGQLTQRPRPAPVQAPPVQVPVQAVQPPVQARARSEVRADFDESEHPRAPAGESGGGQFVSGGGGGGSATGTEDSPDPGKKKDSADVGRSPSAPAGPPRSALWRVNMKQGIMRAGLPRETPIHGEATNLQDLFAREAWDLRAKGEGDKYQIKIEPRAESWTKAVEGRPGEFYDTRVADVNVIAGQSFVVPRVKPNLTMDIPLPPQTGIVYRGMSYEEYNQARKVGFFRSEGIVKFSASAKTEATIGQSYAMQPTFERPGYILAFKQPDMKGEGTIPFGTVEEIVEVRPYTMTAGSVEMVRESDGGSFVEGAVVEPTAKYAYVKFANYDNAKFDAPKPDPVRVALEAGTIAERLGVPPSKFRVIDEPPREFMVGTRSFQEGGHYDPKTDEIVLNARMILGNAQGIAAHEASHQMFEMGMREMERESAAFRAKYPTWETLQVVMKPSGEARTPEAAAMFEKDFPVSFAFGKHLGQGPLAVAGVTPNMDKLIKENGFTDYTKAYWAKDAIGQSRGVRRALDETVADAMRLNTVNGASDRYPGDAAKVPRRWAAMAKALVRLRKAGKL